MIIVTGATGALNGATLEHLLARLPASELGVSVRDPGKAKHLADRGVRVRQGTYDDPVALRRSFDGADQVLLVSSSDPAADQVPMHRRALEAAVEAGADGAIPAPDSGGQSGSPAVTSRRDAAVSCAWCGDFAPGMATVTTPSGFTAPSVPSVSDEMSGSVKVTLCGLAGLAELMVVKVSARMFPPPIPWLIM